MAGSKEDAETVIAFFEDMKRNGLNDPLLVTSDGAPGIIKAIELCFLRTARQRCLVYRMWSLAAKMLEDTWPECKARACKQPTSSRAGQLHASLRRASWLTTARERKRAIARFMDDFRSLHRPFAIPGDP